MEQITQRHDHELDEEEYILMDLDNVADQITIPPNAPYVLSGLDTLNPILNIDGKIKLVGEYVDTIGTCLVFGESDDSAMVHEENSPSEANIISGKCVSDPTPTPSKQVRPITQLHKILKFRLFRDGENEAEK
ncbi:unnamed protein product [Cuscuta campestris]|uniref:Transcription factor TFIIIC triple barrel domain-containing protein n=2 Tax=Cuscuta sect. Cleistogrammica TaxID=1824901 RepID=A0A484KJ19_9ASTE|nr:hypothetical protein DM860_008230 [Cuscuta australis]VFQ64475.1 unnamed protein product [Cuscuta campestris]